MRVSRQVKQEDGRNIWVPSEEERRTATTLVFSGTSVSASHWRELENTIQPPTLTEAAHKSHSQHNSRNRSLCPARPICPFQTHMIDLISVRSQCLSPTPSSFLQGLGCIARALGSAPGSSPPAGHVKLLSLMLLTRSGTQLSRWASSKEARLPNVGSYSICCPVLQTILLNQP